MLHYTKANPYLNIRNLFWQCQTYWTPPHPSISLTPPSLYLSPPHSPLSLPLSHSIFLPHSSPTSLAVSFSFLLTPSLTLSLTLSHSPRPLFHSLSFFSLTPSLSLHRLSLLFSLSVGVQHGERRVFSGWWETGISVESPTLLSTQLSDLIHHLNYYFCITLS